MPRRSCGWPTSRASSCTRTRCVPTTSTIRTSCVWISIRCQAWSGRRFARSRAWCARRSRILASSGWPKTSGNRGMHVCVRIERRWTFDQCRRAALALAREVERRAPALATSKWWKEERHGVFLDYNQNAKDRTVASAYSVRPTADARVSAPLAWEEVDACQPEDFTLATMPARFAAIGDRHAGIDARRRVARDVARALGASGSEGLGDAPWPPHYRKQPGEAPRVAPSKRRTLDATARRDRPCPREGGCPRRLRAVEGPPPRSQLRIWSRRMSWWMRCAAAIARGRGCA